jgi:membrane protein DedA with SNARE-associated domain
MGAFFPTQADASQILPEEPVGFSRVLYYNPDNPVEVMLERSISGSLMGVLVGVLIAFAGGYWFFRPALRKTRRSNSSRRSSRRN